MNFNIPVNFVLNEDIKLEKNALKELNELLKVKDTIKLLKENKDFFVDKEADLLEVSISPDFHKGSGIPIGTTMFTRGFVLPQAIGKDVNCGMRLYTTNLTEEQILKNIDKLEKNIRHIFFEGGRDIPMTSVNREAILKNGLIGLLESSNNMKNQGLWEYYDIDKQEKDLANVNNMGSFITNDTIGLQSFIGDNNISYDSQIGSIGGGNHFVEIQCVTEIHNKAIANSWNLKKNGIVIMIHTGSVSIGHNSGIQFNEVIKRIYPKSLKHPENGIYILPDSEAYAREFGIFESTLYNAANFAFANRLFLGLMLNKAIDKEIKDTEFKLLYDAPHNFVWKEKIDGVEGYIHRKGSCTAKSAEQMQNTNFQYFGEPVFIPGSMGASSYILCGLGNRESLFSASHGAGRKLSRGECLKVEDKLLEEFLKKFKIVTPIDPNRPDLKGRNDILDKWKDEIKKEAPFAYKDIAPIIKAHTDSKVADIVAEVKPILTIKA